jgi:hypothetical protein
VTPLQDVPLTVPWFFRSSRQETRSPDFSFRDSSPVMLLPLPMWQAKRPQGLRHLGPFRRSPTEGLGAEEIGPSY